MRKLSKCFFILMFLWGLAARAQTNTANLTAADSGTCTTAAACLSITLNQNQASSVVQLNGTFSATLQFEGSAQAGGTFVAVNAVPVGGTTAVTSATSTGAWRIAVAGLAQIRVRCSTFVSGTVAVVITSSQGSSANNTSSGGGSGAVGSGAAPIMGFYLGNNCLVANTGSCFNTPADTQQANDCSWTNASTTVTCNTAHFVAADVGKNVMGAKTCMNDQYSTDYGGQITTTTWPTIATFVDSQHVTLSVTPANSASFVNTTPFGACFIWGHPDDAGMSAVDTAMQSATQCPKLFLAAGYYFIQNPHFFTNPPACLNTGMAVGGGFANTILAGGFDVEGRGIGNTALYLAPSFPNGDLCHNLPGPAVTGVDNGGGCFAIPLMGKWSDFRIDGGGQMAPPNFAGGKTLILAAVATIANFDCINYGGATGGLAIGIQMAQQVTLWQVNNSGCGAFGLSGLGNHNAGYRVAVENSFSAAYTQAGTAPITLPTFICYWCSLVFPDNQPFAATGTLDIFGGTLVLEGSYVAIGNAARPPSGIVGESGFLCNSGATCNLVLRDSVLTGGSTNGIALNCTGATACTNYIEKSTVLGQTNAYKDSAGGKLFDLGGNTFTGGANVSGVIIGSSSIAGTTLATVTPSACGTSTIGTLSGSSQKGQFTITFAGTPGTTCTATVTFPVAFLQAPLCTFYDVGGTNVVATSIINGTVNTTSAAVTISGPTFTNANTEIMQYACSNP